MKRYVSLSIACCLVFFPALIPGASAQQKAAGEPIIVGILLLNKPYITEFAGPLDVYHHVPAEKLKVFIISDTDKELVTYEGMPFRANYTIDTAPKLDVLAVPSGAGSLDADLKNTRVIAWIKKAAGEVQWITSHCQGAFLLAEAGLPVGCKKTSASSLMAISLLLRGDWPATKRRCMSSKSCLARNRP